MNCGEAMLKVVEDIYEGGKDLIPNGQLLNGAAAALQRGGPGELSSLTKTEADAARVAWQAVTEWADERKA